MELPLKPLRGGTSFVTAAVSLALMMALGACSGAPEPKPAAAPASPEIKSKVQQIAPPPASSPPLQPTAPMIVERTYPELSILNGLTSEKVHSLLGNPAFKRSDDPAEIWQYRARSCTLDLFMYEAPGGFIRRVEHVEARLKQGTKVTKKGCFADLIKAAETTAKAS